MATTYRNTGRVTGNRQTHSGDHPGTRAGVLSGELATRNQKPSVRTCRRSVKSSHNPSCARCVSARYLMRPDNKNVGHERLCRDMSSRFLQPRYDGRNDGRIGVDERMPKASPLHIATQEFTLSSR